MKLSEAPIGLRVVMLIPMDGEVRWTHYERREGVATYTTNPNKPTVFVKAVRLRTMQGEPGRRPRYDPGEYCVECEVDGRMEVVPEADLTDGPNHDWTPERPEVIEANAAHQAFLAGLRAGGFDPDTDPARAASLWAEYAPGYAEIQGEQP